MKTNVNFYLQSIFLNNKLLFEFTRCENKHNLNHILNQIRFFTFRKKVEFETSPIRLGYITFSSIFHRADSSCIWNEIKNAYSSYCNATIYYICKKILLVLSPARLIDDFEIDIRVDGVEDDFGRTLESPYK